MVQRFESVLYRFDDEVQTLPGVDQPAAKRVLAKQLMRSEHRVRYVAVLRDRPLSDRRADPNDRLFDPVKAAIVNIRRDDIEEAFWCVFWFVHFGRHRTGGYRYARKIYGRVGARGIWSWAETSSSPNSFSRWLEREEEPIRQSGEPGGFGNHRKYESLRRTGRVVESYVAWVAPPRTHAEIFGEAVNEANGDAKKAFDALYRSMASVFRFGRTARFDYLAMVGKLGLARIEPGSAYLESATGPLQGARLLFGLDRRISAERRRQFDAWLVELGRRMDLSMQVVEDALCNWQKSPTQFQHFRG